MRSESRGNLSESPLILRNYLDFYKRYSCRFPPVFCTVGGRLSKFRVVFALLSGNLSPFDE